MNQIIDWMILYIIHDNYFTSFEFKKKIGSVTNPSVRPAYKNLQKFCDKHIDLAKKKYYKKFFKKQWQMINSLLITEIQKIPAP